MLFKRKKEEVSRQTVSKMYPFNKYISQRNKVQVNEQFKRAGVMYNIIEKISKDVAKNEFILNEVVGKDLKEIARTDTYLKNDYIEFLNKPNPLMDRITTIKISTIWWLTNGAIVWIKDFSRPLHQAPKKYDKLKNIFAINPTWIKRYPDTEYEYFDISFNSQTIDRVHKDNVVFYRNPDIHNPYGDFFGDFQALVDEIAIIEKSSEQIASYFHNNMTPPSVVSLEGATQTQAEQIKDRWETSFLGHLKRYIPFFTGTKIQVTKLQSEFKDIELKDLRKEERETLERKFDIIFNLDKANRSTALIVKNSYYENQIIPILDIFVSIYNNEVLPHLDERLVLKYVDPLPKDIEIIKEILKDHPHFATKERLSEITGLALKDYENPQEVLLPSSSVIVDLKTNKVIDYTQTQEKKLKLETITKQIKESLTEEKIKKALNEISEEEIYNDVIDEYINLLENEGNKQIQELDDNLIFDLTTAGVTIYLKNRVLNNVNNITNTFKNEIYSVYLETKTEKGIITDFLGKVKDKITNLYSHIKENNFLTRIVKTETHDALMESKIEAGRQAKENILKTWVTARDEKVRDSHNILDGVTLQLDEYFTSGLGNTALRPGEFNDPADDVNCRCSLLIRKTNLEYNQEIRFKELDKMENILSTYEENFYNAYEKALFKQLDKFVKKINN